jgi:hypothetical protein
MLLEKRRDQEGALCSERRRKSRGTGEVVMNQVSMVLQEPM